MTIALPTKRLTVDEFLVWSERQERGKFELIDGMVVMQQSERWMHSRIKGAVFLALVRAVEQAGIACFAAGEGPTVRIDEHTAFEPDALVAPLPEPDDDDLEIPGPIIVVEVLSPSTALHDATTKLKGYFQLASVKHYLIIDPKGQLVTHHSRAGNGNDGVIETRILTADDALDLQPPGLVVPLVALFGPARSK